MDFTALYLNISLLWTEFPFLKTCSAVLPKWLAVVSFFFADAMVAAVSTAQEHISLNLNTWKQHRAKLIHSDSESKWCRTESTWKRLMFFPTARGALFFVFGGKDVCYVLWSIQKRTILCVALLFKRHTTSNILYCSCLHTNCSGLLPMLLFMTFTHERHRLRWT